MSKASTAVGCAAGLGCVAIIAIPFVLVLLAVLVAVYTTPPP